MSNVLVWVMDAKKVIAICQSGGEFVTNKDGSLSYTGGDAYALDIDHQTQLIDFKSELADMFNCNADTMSIKYFLPGNKKTLITISKDKDLHRMLNFLGDSSTADIFIMSEDAAARNVSNMPASRSSRTTVSEAVVPVVEAADGAVETGTVDDQNNFKAYETPLRAVPPGSSDDTHRKAAQQWENTITGVDQRFNSFSEFREALHKYSIAHGFAYRYKKNDSHRVTVKCKSPGCPWRIYASRLSTTQLVCIKKMHTHHTCEGAAVKAGYRATRGWVGSIIKEKLKVSPNYKPKDIANDIKREYGIQLNYSQAWRAKEIAREQLQGSYKEAYTQLPSFCEKIKETNPGSVATFTTKEDSSFHRLFDGLKKSLAEIFDKCYHGYCLRHLAEKLNRDLKGQFSHEARRFLINDFYAAAYSTKLEGFQRSVENIKGISPDAYNWVIQSEPDHWANAFFGGARYNHMTSGFGQSFYSWVSEAHELPITQMIDVLRGKMMESIYTRRVESNQWTTKLTPSMEEKLQKETLTAQTLHVSMSHHGGSTFEVRGESVEIVDVDNWDCSCRGWQLEGLPCCHAIAVMEWTGRSPYEYCSRYFTVESYRLTFAESIQPIPDVDKPVAVSESSSQALLVTVTPPPTKRPPGRPKMKQTESIDMIKRQLQCSKCKGLGHNKKTCKNTLPLPSLS
ncbi:hypothetical protein TIFTF001_024181 [Ficus carica]|uniref:SWIM-type domain-containing protein n=1 Tax=Ficus carica TaxID=3494 RepID=A0AA88AKW5_FICCA|nr:hypothetical protein TIFTF001_024181 [Ficus carica]